MRISSAVEPSIQNFQFPRIEQSDAATESSFVSMIKEKIQEVDHTQHKADQTMEQGALEGPTNIHESMLKLEEADISLRLLTKTRDKALEAYQEVMRMQF